MNKNFKLILKEILLIILFLFLSLTTAEIGSYILPQYEYQLSFVITAFILLAAYKILKLIFKSLYLIHSNKFSTFCFWGGVIGLTGILSLFIVYCILFALTLLIIKSIRFMKKSQINYGNNTDEDEIEFDDYIKSFPMNNNINICPIYDERDPSTIDIKV